MSDQVVSYALTGDASGAKVAFNDVGAAINANTKAVAQLAKGFAASEASVNAGTKKLQEAATASEKVTQGLRNAAMQIPPLQSGLGTLGPSLAALANPLVLLPAAFAGAAVGAGSLAMANADLIEHLDNLHASTGLSVNELYNLREIAIPMGLEFDSLAKSAQKLAINLGTNGKEIQALKLGGGDIVEVMAQVADRFAAAGSTVEKDAIGYAAFGKSFAEIAPILAQGGDRIRRLSQDMAISDSDLDKYRELDETSDQLESHWRQIKFDIGGIASGPMTSLLGMAKELTGILNSDPKEKGSLAYIRRLASDPALALRGYGIGNTGAENSRIVAEYERSQADDALMARAGQIAQARKDAAEKAEKERLDALREAREKALPKELALQQDLRDSIAAINATADQREILAIQSKYDKIIREHQNGKTREIAELARQAELQNLSMRRNFGQLGTERDADQALTSLEDADARRRFQNPWQSADAYRLGSRMQELGLVGANGVGVYDSTQMSLEEMRRAIANAEGASEGGTLSEQEQEAERLQKTYESLANYVSGDFASHFSGTFLAMQNGQKNFAQGMKDIWVNSLQDIEAKVIELAAKFAMLTAINALTGGAAGATGGFFDYIIKGIAGHADGTLSARGGLTTLSERGVERILTPQGGDFYASRGLYGISPGSQVIPASQVSGRSGGKLEVHQYFSGSDPIQIAEQAQRTANETVSRWDSYGYRTRQID